jgi:hypothetical protein
MVALDANALAMRCGLKIRGRTTYVNGLFLYQKQIWVNRHWNATEVIDYTPCF